MASGIGAEEDVIKACADLKSDKDHAYVVMVIKDEKIIVLSSVGGRLKPRDAEQSKLAFEEMKKEVNKLEGPCYIVFDFIFKRKDGVDKDKVIFIAWCPDSSTSPKQRMVHSSSKDGLRKKVGPDFPVYQINELDDMDYNAIAESLKAKDRS